MSPSIPYPCWFSEIVHLNLPAPAHTPDLAAFLDKTRSKSLKVEAVCIVVLVSAEPLIASNLMLFVTLIGASVG
jgi:hypothetical protein